MFIQKGRYSNIVIHVGHQEDRFEQAHPRHQIFRREHGDFIPPDRLDEFMSEVRRVTAPGGFVVMFSQDRMSKEGAETGRPSSFRLEADDRILRTPSSGPPRPRWAYANRAIEQALSPLSIQGIHLHGNRIREVVARKRPR